MTDDHDNKRTMLRALCDLESPINDLHRWAQILMEMHYREVEAPPDEPVEPVAMMVAEHVLKLTKELRAAFDKATTAD